jgi:hypothetical protein
MKIKIADFIKNPYFIISLLSLIFLILFLIHIFTVSLVILPSFWSLLIFCFSIFFLIGAYMVLKETKESKSIFVLLFLIAFSFESLIFLSMPMNTERWADARGYYNLAIFTAENNPLYLIQNYHRLANWNLSFCPDAEIRLGKLVKNEIVLEFIKNKLQIHNPLGLSEYNFYNYNPDRAALHPPGWIFILYLFIVFFGSYEIVAIVAEFILAAFLIVIVYWFLRKNTNFNNALSLTFLFIITPAFVLHSAAPLMDVPLAI